MFETDLESSWEMDTPFPTSPPLPTPVSSSAYVGEKTVNCVNHEETTVPTARIDDDRNVYVTSEDKKENFVNDYVGRFDNSSCLKSLTVSKLPHQIIDAQRLAMEAKLFSEQMRVLRDAERRESDIVYREHMARERIKILEQQSYERLLAEKKKALSELLDREEMFSINFRKAKKLMQTEMESQERRILEKHGQLLRGGTPYSREYYVKTLTNPEAIEVRIHSMRAVKNKLLKGLYVIKVTPYDRLGGFPIHWSKNCSLSNLPSVTSPTIHHGRYFDRTLKFDESVFVMCPPQIRIKPSNCLVFELFLIGENSSSKDVQIAWAPLPICNEHFGIINGKFKLPLLKGEYGPHSPQHYKKIEEVIADDLNTWLCNLYLEVRCITVDDVGTKIDRAIVGFNYITKGVYHHYNGVCHEKGRNDSIEMKLGETDILNSPRNDTSNNARCGSKLPLDRSLSRSIFSSSQRNAHNVSHERELIERGYDIADEFFMLGGQRGELSGLEAISKKCGAQWAAMGLEGKVVRNLRFDGSRFDMEMFVNEDNNYDHRQHVGVISTTDGELSLPNEDKVEQIKSGNSPNNFRQFLTEAKNFDDFHASVVGDPSRRRHLLPSAVQKTKLRYLFSEIVDDILPGDLGRLWTFDVYVAYILLITAYWAVLYLHYIYQYLFLLSLNTPIFGFRPDLFQIVFKYSSSSLPLLSEIGIVTMGPVGVMITFCFFIIICIIYDRISRLPKMIWKYVTYFGVFTVLDPLNVFLLNLCDLQFSCAERSSTCKLDYTSEFCNCFVGDAFKLYERLHTSEGSGVTGNVILMILYSSIFVFSAILLYEYLVTIHDNGRLLDIWRRINAPNDEFFVPLDFEVSHEELQYICHSASTWRGRCGESRRVQISNYFERDPYDPFFEERIVHYAIYELAQDGRRTLHRQFLLMASGAVVEIFDQFLGDSAQKNRVLSKLLSKNQRLHSTQISLNRINPCNRYAFEDFHCTVVLPKN